MQVRAGIRTLYLVSPRRCHTPATGCVLEIERSQTRRVPATSFDTIGLLMFHATTVLAVRHGGQTVMASDGQVTFGETVVKQTARKIRKLYNDKVLAGFAGSAADSFA